MEKLFKLYGIKKKSYSPRTYAIESGTYQDGYAWPQTFFEDYPPLTLYKMMLIFKFISDESDTFSITYRDNLYTVTFNINSVTKESLSAAFSELMVILYDSLDELQRQYIKGVLS